MKKLSNFFITVFFIVAALLLVEKSDMISSLTNLFEAKPLVIDETPVLLKEIKSIGQLITYTSFDEVVADTTILTPGSAFVNAFNRFSPVPILPSADKQLVLIGKGKVLAGTDLSLLTDSSIVVNRDTIIVFLPKSKIIETIVNPSDFEIFIEKGPLTSEEVTLVKLKARQKIESRAMQQNILIKADEKSKVIVRNFLASMGYKKVLIY